ncbi:MAG: N-acetylglucosamine-6-phosphate deacetylase [Planctomycetaceae bacterium]
MSDATPVTFHARRYDTGTPVEIALAGNRIRSIGSLDLPATPVDWPYVAPGLVDVQINGYGGVWFADRELTPEGVERVLDAFLARGVVRICPTLITSSFETLAAGFESLRQACEQSARIERMAGQFHLEGPYLSAEDGPRGAHLREFIRPADWDEFSDLQRVSGNRIRLVTVAPEVPHALEFIRRAVSSGVVIALGHTAATTEEIVAAVDAGARLSTHLGNGAHRYIRRHPNCIWDQLGEPRLSASLITDGHHLPDSVIRSMVWAKSPARCVLISDASGWAGCAPGAYENELGRAQVLADGRIVVAGQETFLAGSGSTTEQCVAHAVRAGACSWREALDMAGRNPGRLLRLDHTSLQAGDPADLFVYRIADKTQAIEVLATVEAGEVRFGALPGVK